MDLVGVAIVAINELNFWRYFTVLCIGGEVLMVLRLVLLYRRVSDELV